ncbi:hypothetical protein N8I77_012035 [Diaporthe amygdali]|uniref:Uncharacterized protein n=1 Tax=Phomopsis amygdali TaxID=1214568 RepID=A0AAD9S3X3_PHOAM|nr:hypothetical protein N8I77_012035 [Diaporthe amygdali]
MEKMKAGGVRHDDEGPVNITLFDRGDDEGPNLQCDPGDDGSKAVTCRETPFGDCCQGEERNELIDSASNNQAEGWKSFAIYSGNDRSPCNTFARSTSSSDIKCLDGGEQGWTISGAAVEGSTGDGDGDNGGGNDAAVEENRGGNKPKKRARRANLYSFLLRETMYHIEINSSLGETYRNLATKAEQREFMIEHGKAEPYNRGSRLWAAR